jgi:hypothetical protein
MHLHKKVELKIGLKADKMRAGDLREKIKFKCRRA